jgi:hypothetical protein
MPTQDLGSVDDFEVSPVEGNPFAGGQDDFDVEPVDHDPFAGENPAPSPLTSADIKRMGGFGTIRAPDEQPLGAALQHETVEPALEGLGMSRTAAQNIGQGFGDLTRWGALPVVSQAAAYDEAKRAYGAGNYPAAALGAVAALPMPGGAVEGAIAHDFPTLLARHGMHEATPIIDATGRFIHGGGDITQIGGAMARMNADGTLTPGILAYHGSPHAFEGPWDISKVGTGEGNISFGHGLYFAESPGVASGYRPEPELQTLHDPQGQRITFGTDDPERMALMHLREKGSFDAARAALAKDQAYFAGQDPADVFGDALRNLDQWQRGGYTLKRPGASYQVALNENPEHFLDWDAPLHRQHPVVRQALKDVGLPSIVTQGGQLPTGQMAYMRLAREQEPVGFAGMLPNQDEQGFYGASQALLDAGLPGVKYLDQHSRLGSGAQQLLNLHGGDKAAAIEHAQDMAAQHGGPMGRALEKTIADLQKPQSRNYVMFDDKNIDTLKRFGFFSGAVSLPAAIEAARQAGENPTVYSDRDFRWTGGRVGFQFGGDAQSGMYDEPQPQGFTGHVFATPEPGQPMSERYVAAHAPSLTQGEVEPGRWLGEDVYNVARSFGAEPEHAQGLGNLVQYGYGWTPGGSAEGAYHSARTGDFPGTVGNLAGVFPVFPGARGAEEAGTAIKDIGGTLRMVDPRFSEGRISTTLPDDKWLTDPVEGGKPVSRAHSGNEWQISHDLAQWNPDTYVANAKHILSLDGLPPLLRQFTNEDAERIPDVIHEAYIEHMKNNLIDLHNAIDKDTREGSKRWYVGANDMTRDWANEFRDAGWNNLTHENVAGVVAAQSPQRDWDMNVANARRILDVMHNEGDKTLSQDQFDWLENYARGNEEAFAKKVAKAQREGKPAPVQLVSGDGIRRITEGMRGKTLNEMEPDEAAYFIRSFDQAHGPHNMPIDDLTKEARPRGFYVMDPTGKSTGKLLRATDGSPKTLTWGSMDEIANSVRAARADNMVDVSKAMGEGHKVRNFYNNIIAPFSKAGDTTIDTHATGANMLMPVGGTSQIAKLGMGMTGSYDSGTGSAGLYAANKEAYLRAANELGILPRELQSITWEGVRGLFTPEEKRMPSVVNRNRLVWRAYSNGYISRQDALDAILRHDHEGNPVKTNIRPPRWKTGDYREADEPAGVEGEE